MRLCFCVVLFLVLSLPCSAAENKLLRGPYLQNPSKNNITIKYRTQKSSPTLIKYWKLSSPQVIYKYEDLVLETDHRAVLIGLEGDTVYEYEIESQQKKSLENISQKSYRFKTQNSKEEALVYVLGDPGVEGFKNFRQNYKNNQKKVLDSFLSFKPQKNLRDPDLILSLGDNTYFYGFDDEYQKGFFDQYSDLLMKIPVYTVFGNHDAGINKEFFTYNSRSYPSPRGVYFKIFDSPTQKPYYSFDLGGAHFIVLDSFDSLWEDLKTDRSNYEKPWSNQSKSRNSMLDWLEADLSSHKSNWTIVAFHHPPYGSDDEGSNKQELWRAWMNAYVVPVIEKHKVDLVLCGHIHNYQRSFPVKSILDTSVNEGSKKKTSAVKKHKALYQAKTQQLLIDTKLNPRKPLVQSSKLNNYMKNTGTIYTILGSSGAAFNPIEDNPDKMFAVQAQIEGSAVLSITAKELNFKFITIKGDIIDEFTIQSK